MGFIRGALVVLISVILFISLLITGLFITVSSSLTYDNVHDKLVPIIQETLKEEMGVDIFSEIEKEIGSMEIHCEDYPEDYVFSEGGYTINLSCDALTQGTDAIIASGVDNIIESVYYKEYNCEFWKCFSEEEIPLFLVSEYARDYWKGLFFKAFLLSLILAAGLVLLSKRKSRGFVLTGAIVIVSSIVVLQFSKIGAFVAKLILSPISGAVSSETSQIVLADIVGIFFSSSNTVFVWMFVIGILFGVAGIVLRLFRVGFKISAFFKKIESKDAEKVKVVEKVKEVKGPIKEVKEVKPIQKPKKK